MERRCIKKSHLQADGYKDLEDWLSYPNHIYIGRRNHWVKGAEDSLFKNPYSLNKYSRKEALKLFKKYAKNNLCNQLDQLKGKILGCWCTPEESCHGDILIDLLNEK